MPTDSRSDKSFGSLLKEARLARNVSLQDVSKRTRIHVNILQAIESDDVRSLGHVYAKSFLKLYAEYLNVDKEEVLRRFAAATGSDQARGAGRIILPAEKAARKAEKNADLVFVDRFFALAAAALKKINLRAVLAILILFFVVFGISKFVAHRKKTPAVPLPADAKKSQVKKGAVSAASTGKIASPPQKPPVAAPKEPVAPPFPVVPAAPATEKADKKIVLVVRTKEKCYIQVRQDGKVVFQSTLAKGASESWQADERIDLVLGNAGAVQLEINGRLFSKIGRPGQTLRNVVVTRAGLSIRK